MKDATKFAVVRRRRGIAVVALLFRCGWIEKGPEVALIDVTKEYAEEYKPKHLGRREGQPDRRRREIRDIGVCTTTGVSLGSVGDRIA